MAIIEVGKPTMIAVVTEAVGPDDFDAGLTPLDVSKPSAMSLGKHVACDTCGLEMHGNYLGGDPCPRTFECAGELGPVCSECKAINSPRYELCAHASEKLAADYVELCERRRVRR